MKRRKDLYPFADELIMTICREASLDYRAADGLSTACLELIEAGATPEADLKLLLAARHAIVMRNRR